MRHAAQHARTRTLERRRRLALEAARLMAEHHRKPNPRPEPAIRPTMKLKKDARRVAMDVTD